MGALEGRTVVAFERRRAAEFEKLLIRHGADFHSAPAVCEVPIDQTDDVHRLFDEIEAGRIEAIILQTGVGTRALLEAAASRRNPSELVDLLARITRIARGPKPVAALREIGLEAHVRAPEPNTWREILSEIDRTSDLRGQKVAVQEYGRPNPDLLDGLRQRGVEPLPVAVYRWALPDDLAPLEKAISMILEHRVDVVAFTTAVQLDHLLLVAGQRREDLLRALGGGTALASIGPTASEALRKAGLEPAITPEHPKLGYLAAAIAAWGGEQTGGECPPETGRGKSRSQD